MQFSARAIGDNEAVGGSGDGDDALVVQSPYLEGYDSVTLVTRILRGEVDPATLEDVAYPPMVVATRDNLDSPEVAKNLYVDSCP